MNDAFDMGSRHDHSDCTSQGQLKGMRKFLLLLMLLFCVLPLGCAPARLTEGVRYAAEKYGVADASTSLVRGKSYLRFDAGLRADLDELLEISELQQPTRDEAAKLLMAANELAIQQTFGELERMPPEGMRWLATRYEGTAEDGDLEERLGDWKNRYRGEAKRELDVDLAQLDAGGDVRRFLRDTRRSLCALPGDRGRTARALLGAPFFVPAMIGAEVADAEATQRSLVADFEQVVQYSPKHSAILQAGEDLSSLDLPLLADYFAPVIVQQVRPNAPYGINEDRIGKICLAGSADDIHVNVDTSQPTVYWTHSQARIGQKKYDQLLYVAWYPSRPALSKNDVQAGSIDGVVVRITLDGLHRPAIYEFVRACGCYHTLWVSEFVETTARSEFGVPTGTHQFAVERDKAGRSLFLPSLVRDDGTTPRRPFVYVDSGYHLVLAISPTDTAIRSDSLAEERTYQLAPYESLTRLPLGNAVASMFANNGLVHHASRKEGLLLAPTGMLKAGQPRQLGTMKIRMDDYDHDDPRLLERNLRLPTNF